MNEVQTCWIYTKTTFHFFNEDIFFRHITIQSLQCTMYYGNIKTLGFIIESLGGLISISSNYSQSNELDLTWTSDLNAKQNNIVKKIYSRGLKINGFTRVSNALVGD